MAVTGLGFIKFLELAITVACLGLLYKTQNTGDFNTDFLTGTAFGGYFIILLGGLGGHVSSNSVGKKVDVFFCFAGCAVFVAAGALNIKIYDNYGRGENRDYGLAKASLAVINGALFLIDALLTLREK